MFNLFFYYWYYFYLLTFFYLSLCFLYKISFRNIWRKDYEHSHKNHVILRKYTTLRYIFIHMAQHYAVVLKTEMQREKRVCIHLLSISV